MNENDFSKVDKIVRETGCRGKECLGKGCQLEGADFSNQDLRGFIFNNANLRGADFRGANIDDAQFIETDLTGANLETNLIYSYFTDALLENATYDSRLKVTPNLISRIFGSTGITDPKEKGMLDIRD
ncbi:MAG: pentapeptide repeat-containing protein [Bdellovibrionales bacterium]|nr:pentapeptide repeat-containing protein [Bdellovibrionales bacterium]